MDRQLERQLNAGVIAGELLQRYIRAKKRHLGADEGENEGPMVRKIIREWLDAEERRLEGQSPVSAQGTVVDSAIEKEKTEIKRRETGYQRGHHRRTLSGERERFKKEVV